MENDASRQLGYPFGMLSEWLRQALEATGFSQAQLSRELTFALGRSIDRAAVNKMLTGGRKISADELVAITTILKINPPASMNQNEGLRTVIVAAHVQAGEWSETWEWSDDEKYPVVIRADPLLYQIKLYAAEARGPSMNRRWPEGTVLIFSNIAETQESPIPGKRYIVERRRRGGEAEHTVKLLYKDPDGKHWLMPESDDPRYQTPISIDDGLDEEDEVTILGRVRYAVTRE